jgi:hypothetical protein
VLCVLSCALRSGDPSLRILVVDDDDDDFIRTQDLAIDWFSGQDLRPVDSMVMANLSPARL